MGLAAEANRPIHRQRGKSLVSKNRKGHIMDLAVSQHVSHMCHMGTQGSESFSFLYKSESFHKHTKKFSSLIGNNFC